jgi:hypothetical protein
MADYRESKRRSADKRRKKYRDYLNKYKMERGCEQCGYNEHFAALELDHIDPSTKLFDLSRGRDHPWDKFVAELEKCRVLCSNCHRIHTYLTVNDRHYSIEDYAELVGKLPLLGHLNK